MNDVYASGSRQITVDVLRGYFILSMASGHLATGFLTNLLHVWVWVDGAAGFVCLSGFVLGLSQRAKWQRTGDNAGQLWILRRTGQIWFASIMLTVIAQLGRFASGHPLFIEDVFSGDEFPRIIIDILFLQYTAPYMGLLSKYVVFLLFAFITVGALKRNRSGLVIIASIIVYFGSQVPELWMPTPDETEVFSLQAWQILFFPALVAGWHWQDKLRPLVAAYYHWIAAICTIGTLGFLVFARADEVSYVIPIEWDPSPYFTKYSLSLPVVVYFVFVLGFLAAAIESVRRWSFLTPFLQAVALLGRHSLACFIILSLVHLLAWIVMEPGVPQDGRHIGWLALCLVAFTIYCLTAERKTGRRPAPGIRPTAASSAYPREADADLPEVSRSMERS